jgi:hypothetical protein
MPIIYGENSDTLTTDLVEVSITRRAGHLAPVTFQLGDRKVSPYALAPWQPGEIDPSLPELLLVLRGDFLCFPFGGSAERPPHGVTANRQWSLVEKDAHSICLSISDVDGGASVEKQVSLRDGETAIYQQHRITGADGVYNYGNHPILDFSQLPEGAGRVSVSPFRWGSVYPGLFSNPENREYGALKPGAIFTDLHEVPLANGGTTDLTRYPARKGFDDLVMMVSQPATDEQPFAWSAAVLDGYVWFSLKNPVDFPATLFWISNGGRHAEPWNGRHLGRLGIEEVCSHFSDGPDISRENRLTDFEIPTARRFSPETPVALRIIQGVVAVPEGFGAVTAICPDGPDSVRIIGESENAVFSAIHWRDFLAVEA